MKNKLYKVNYSYRIHGRNFTFFKHKPIDIKIDREAADFFMTNEERMEEKIKNSIDEKIEIIKKELEENGKLGVVLIDYNESLYSCEKTIKEIVSVEPLKYSYREATMEEYIKNAPYTSLLEELDKTQLSNVITNYVKKDR